MGDGTPESPYTREDVLRLRDEFVAGLQARLDAGVSPFDLSKADTTLDLTGKVFGWQRGFERTIDLEGVQFSGMNVLDSRLWVSNLAQADLKGANLKGADLTEVNIQGAYLDGASLQGARLNGANLAGTYLNRANLAGAHLWRVNLVEAHLGGATLAQAHLTESNLQRAYLSGAHLEGARLEEVDLEGAYLWGAHLEGARLRGWQGWQQAIGLETVDWGDFILGEEGDKQYEAAISPYHQLKTWHREHGVYDRAAAFAFREAECRRKAASWRHNFVTKLWLWATYLLAGHGERPLRTVVAAIAVLLVFALGYSFDLGGPWYEALGRALYFSAVSLVALGYGSWVDGSDLSWWSRGFGVFETFLGVFMTGLFLVLFVRKMAR